MELTMLDTIQDFIKLVSREKLTLEDMVTFSGTIEHDYGSNVIVKPRDASFTDINIVHRYQSSDIAHISLTLRDPVPETALIERYGTPQRIAREERQPAQLIFYLPQPDSGYDIALIATLSGDRVTEIALRRDRH